MLVLLVAIGGLAIFSLLAVGDNFTTYQTYARGTNVLSRLQAVGLSLCVIFPELVLWLPRQVYGP